MLILPGSGSQKPKPVKDCQQAPVKSCPTEAVSHPVVDCKHEVIDARTLSECPNVPLVPVGRRGPLVAKIPVVLAEPQIQIALEAVVKLPEPVLEIKRILKDVCVTQCKMVPAGRFSQQPPFGQFFKLFLAGFVRKNIEYATVKCSDWEGVSGDIRHTTVKVPFDCVTEIFVPENEDNVFGTQSRFQPNGIQGCNVREQLRNDFIQFREDPFCELEFAEINELDILEGPVHGFKKSHCDDTFTTLREKMVIQLVLKVLQKQQVEVPAPAPTPTPTPGIGFTGF